MPDHPAVLVAVLAAGASRRLGRPKQLVELPSGEVLLRRQCRIALDADVGNVVVVLGCKAEECAAGIADRPVTTLINAAWEEGLASSIRVAARAAMDARAAGLLVLHGDQYRVTAGDLRALHNAWQATGGGRAVRARNAEYAGPPVVLPAACLPAALTLEGEEGARRVLESLGPDGVLDVSMPNAAFDLDLPEQLGRL
jgi:CTP:molybdopterin cytidylyltransferase MocA